MNEIDFVISITFLADQDDLLIITEGLAASSKSTDETALKVIGCKEDKGGGCVIAI